MFTRSDYLRVAPNALAAYLRGHGWNQMSSDDVIAVWRKDGRDIVAPVVNTLDDYEEAIYSAVLRLAKALGRRAELVLQDLLSVVYDVIELRGVIGIDELSTIPLRAAEDTIQSLTQIALASAFATSSALRRGVVPSRRPSRVTEFVESLKFGPYTNGARGYALFAPIPLALQASLWEVASEPRPFHSGQLPFERLVTSNIPEYIQAATVAATEAHETGTMKPFEIAVEKGVNTTLLRGIRQMLKVLPEIGGGFEIEYSPLVYVQGHSKVRLMSQSVAEVLPDAIEYIESKEPEDISEVIGPVISLGRNPDDIQGVTIVTAFLNRRPQNVYMRLDDDSYEVALLAHKQRANVQVTGKLRRESRRRVWLDDPTDLKLEEEPEDEVGDREVLSLKKKREILLKGFETEKNDF